MLICQALRRAEDSLLRSGVLSPRLDAEVLLSEILRCDRAFLLGHPEAPLSAEAEEILGVWVERRSRGLPVAYILGKKEFWSLEFMVTPAVLIPRPETELLVEASMQMAERGEKEEAIAEVGCGSGAVVVSLARELREGEFYASDASADALWVARQNAIRHGVAERISFLRGDLLGAFAGRGMEGKLDQILANPPYIPSSDICQLPREIRLYEPKQALNGGKDGLSVYRRLIPEARRFLKPGGWLVLEMGEGQGEAISGLLAGSRGFEEVKIFRDYRGIDRVISARRG